MIIPGWRKLRVMGSVYYAYMVEYRAEIFLWALSGLFPLIIMGVWVQASRTGKFEASPVDFMRYFLAVFVVRQFTVVWVVWEFEYDLVQGQLSSQLLWPIDPVWRHVMMHIGERLARLPFTVVLVVVFFAMYPEALWRPRLADVGLGVAAVAWAFVLRFAMQYTSAMLSFWTERASAIEQLVFLLQLFLSGTIAPLEVFPPAVREAALWLPFAYVVYFPASLITGQTGAISPWQGFAVMAGWTVVFVALNRWMWRKGLKRYSGMGA